jgi:hypothetical protein
MNFLRCAPYFPVNDVKKTADFYVLQLGFAVEYSAGDPPEFAIVSRDGIPLMLRLVQAKIVPIEHQGGSWDAFFWVTSALELFEEYRSKVEIVYGIVPQPYGYEEFAVRDLDGHVLGFGSPIK